MQTNSKTEEKYTCIRCGGSGYEPAVGNINTVTITKKEYDELNDAAFELECLHQGDVDHWEWYHESLKDGGYFDE